MDQAEPDGAGGTLHVATEADLPAVVALVNMSYRGQSARQGWAHEADLIEGERIGLATLRADLVANRDARLLLHRDPASRDVLGCVWLEPVGDDVWYAGMLTIRPDLQDRGLGRRLLQMAEEHAARAGARGMRLTVIDVRDTLIAWYARRGYCPTGEVRPFPSTQPPRPDLTMIVLEKVLQDRSDTAALR